MHSASRRSRRPRNFLLTLTAAICSLAVIAAPSAMAAQACSTSSAAPTEASKRTVVRATLCSINAERSRHGLGPLKLNRRLSAAATAHAADMDARNYFSHDSLDGGSFVDRIRRAGYLSGARSWKVGENLAWGSHERSTPGAITQSWMKSPGHRANILSSSFREIGIGVVNGAPQAGISPAATYATSFGARS